MRTRWWWPEGTGPVRGLPADPEVATTDAFRLLMADAARHRLLTGPEEIALARRIEAGDRAARERLVSSNVRLVVAIARRYRGQGLEQLDLIQEGMIGLMRATDLFDWRRGRRFSTYATGWVHQSILRGLANHGRTIRLPVRAREERRRMDRVAEDLRRRLGRAPTEDEVASSARVSPRRALALRDAARAIVSLDQPVGPGAGARLGEVLPAGPDDPLGDHQRDALLEAVRAGLSRLPARQADILRMRFGLDGDAPRTLVEVGQVLGVSRERVRQIERAALDRLASEPGIAALRDAA